MKRTIFPLLITLGFVILNGCGGGSSAPAAAAPSQPQAVTGVDTPKSVSVVTAN